MRDINHPLGQGPRANYLSKSGNDGMCMFVLTRKRHESLYSFGGWQCAQHDRLGERGRGGNPDLSLSPTWMKGKHPRSEHRARSFWITGLPARLTTDRYAAYLDRSGGGRTRRPMSMHRSAPREAATKKCLPISRFDLFSAF